jgi:hypothetical protein
MATSENAEAIGKTVWLARRAAVATDKPITPFGAFKVGHARRFVREHSLELRKRAGKRQVVSLKHVDNHGCCTLKQMPNILQVVGLGDNPISTFILPNYILDLKNIIRSSADGKQFNSTRMFKSKH